MPLCDILTAWKEGDSMAKNGTMDLTTGRPVKQILLFSLPLVAGTLFQQLYSFVDTVMVGRLISNDALAAVGATSAMSYMILGFVLGSCTGFSIPLAKAVGARQPEEFKRYFFNGCWLCLGLSILVTLLTVALADPLLRLINTPADIFADAKTYIIVIFLGIPGTYLYNFCSSALRAVGDSQRPTYFLLASSILNIALDYALIVIIPMGVAGAALATIISQLVSGLLNLYWLTFRTDVLKNSAGLRRPSLSHIRQLFKVGFPMGFDHCFSAFGTVLMQSAINSLGTAAVTGQTAGEKIRQMFTLPMESVGMGMATYAGQNDGANRPDRIRDGIKAGLTIQLTYCVFAWIAIHFGKGAFTALVLGPDSGLAGQLSVQYLGIMSCLFCFHGSLMIMRNTLQGMGHSAQAVLSGFCELGGRAVGSWLSVAFFGFTGVCFASPMAWGTALVYCSIMVAYLLKKRMRA